MGEWQRQQQQRLKPDPKLEPKLDLPPTLKSLAQLQSHFGVFGVSDRGYICLLSVRNTAALTTEYLGVDYTSVCPLFICVLLRLLVAASSGCLLAIFSWGKLTKFTAKAIVYCCWYSYWGVVVIVAVAARYSQVLHNALGFRLEQKTAGSFAAQK